MNCLLQALRLLEVLWIMSAMRSLSCVPRFLPDPHSLYRRVATKGHQVSVHFTSYSAQLGVLVVVAFIVNDQDVFDGLRHDGGLPIEPNRHQQILAGLGETRQRLATLRGTASGTLSGSGRWHRFLNETSSSHILFAGAGASGHPVTGQPVHLRQATGPDFVV